MLPIPTRWRPQRVPLKTVWSLLMLGSIFYALPHSIAWAQDSVMGCGGEYIAIQNGGYEAAVVTLVNERRAEQNLPPMKLVRELSEAARYHAADMTQDNYFDHDSYDRNGNQLTAVCSWSTRIRGYYTGARSVGENIAAGYRSPESVMEGWMNSTGHRNNILGNFTEIGVGYHSNRWVQDFGRRDDVLVVIINREAAETASAQVSIYIHGSGSQVRLRNDGGTWSDWQNFQNELTWTLGNNVGERLVEVEVQRGSSTVTGSDVIQLTAAGPAPTATPTVAPTIVPTIVPTTPPTPTPTRFPPQEYREKVYLPLVTR